MKNLTYYQNLMKPYTKAHKDLAQEIYSQDFITPISNNWNYKEGVIECDLNKLTIFILDKINNALSLIK